MIKTWIRALVIGLLTLTVIVAVLMALAWTMLPLDGIAIRLHDETFSLADLQGAPAVLFFVLAVAVVVIAALAVLAMIAVGLGFGVIGIAVGLLATAGSLALVVAPFVLIGWLVWRFVGTQPAPRAAAAP